MGLFSKIRNAFAPKVEELPAEETETMYGPMDRIMQYRWLAADFLKNIMGQTDTFISDFSTLWDFHEEESNDRFYEAAKERYGVDIRDVPEAKFLPILEKINAEAKTRFWMFEDPSLAPEVRTSGAKVDSGN